MLSAQARRTKEDSSSTIKNESFRWWNIPNITGGQWIAQCIGVTSDFPCEDRERLQVKQSVLGQGRTHQRIDSLRVGSEHWNDFISTDANRKRDCLLAVVALASPSLVPLSFLLLGSPRVPADSRFSLAASRRVPRILWRLCVPAPW